MVFLFVEGKFGRLISFLNTCENTCCVSVILQFLFLMWLSVAMSDTPPNVDLK